MADGPDRERSDVTDDPSPGRSDDRQPLPTSLRPNRDNLLRDRPTWLPLLLTAAATLAIYPRLPEQMVVHWNAAGEPDGWMPRSTAAAFGLLVPAAIYLLLWLLPAIDPRRRNYARFEGAYRLVRSLTVFFMLGIHGLVILTALGVAVAVDRIIPFGLGALFVGLGNVMAQVRHNYFVGFRTPWTLADEGVWRKTHRFGARAMVAAGLVTMLLSLPGGTWALTGVLVATALMTIGTVGYSYLAWVRTVR